MEENKYIVDRIEENYVVLENGKDNVFNVKKSDIIGNIKEGDIVYIKDNLYFIDERITELRKKEIDNLMKGLWEE